MLKTTARSRILFLLASVPLLGGCSEDFWYREPRVAGQIERVAFVGGPQAQRLPKAEEGLLPAPVLRRGIALQDNTAPLAPRQPVALGGSLSGSPDGPVGPTVLRTDDMAVLEQVNRVRAQHGLGAIQFNTRLFNAARAHSDEQLRQNFLGHGSLDPDRVRLSDRMLAAGYVGRVYAEVVARDYMTVEAVVRAWMDSPTHREVLLDPELSEGAFCRLDSADGRTNRWTGDFGAPDAFATPVPPQLPAVPKPSAAPPMAGLRSTEPAESRSLGNPPTSAPRSSGAAPAAPAPASIAPSAVRGPQPAVAGLGSRPAITSPPPPPPPALGPTRAFVPTPVPPAAPPMVRSLPQPTYAATPPPRYVPPAYQPPVIQPRQPVLIRRPVRRVGDCAT